MSKFWQISNGTEVDKILVWLDKVDNTADADKPISTATQDALDNKENWLWAPDTDDYILSSKSDWTRAWVEMTWWSWGSTNLDWWKSDTVYTSWDEIDWWWA